MLEAAAIHEGRSAYNHLLCVAQSNGIGRRRVEEVLGIVGLTSVAKRRAGRFSMGMGQRLGIGVALLGDPELLIFDEPVNGLDPEGIVWIRNLMRSLGGRGTDRVRLQPPDGGDGPDRRPRHRDRQGVACWPRPASTISSRAARGTSFECAPCRTTSWPSC